MESNQFSGNRSVCIRTISLKSILSNHIMFHDGIWASVKEPGKHDKCLPGTTVPFWLCNTNIRHEEFLGRKMDYSQHWCNHCKFPSWNQVSGYNLVGLTWTLAFQLWEKQKIRYKRRFKGSAKLGPLRMKQAVSQTI